MTLFLAIAVSDTEQVRAHVWAASIASARTLFTRANPECELQQLVPVLDSRSPEFSTLAGQHGWRGRE